MLMKRSIVLLVVVTLTAGGSAACGDDDSDGGGEVQQPAVPIETGAGEVTFVATEYEFEAPSSLPRGRNTIRLRNEGKEDHELILFQLKPDAPPVQQLAKLPRPKAIKFVATNTGSIPPIAPGKTSSPDLVADLAPGTYGFVCFIRSPEGKPHAVLGMADSLVVRESGEK